MYHDLHRGKPHHLPPFLRGMRFGRGGPFNRPGDDPAWNWPPMPGRGRGGPWGGRTRDRLFDRGDIKYVILDLLQERPRHGYDIIRALEERFQGFYTPSPGTVYPALQLLEDQDYVTSSVQDGKKVYTVTDAGRAFLKDRADTLAAIRARTEAGRGGNADLHALMQEFREFAQTLHRSAAGGAFHDAERIRRLRAVIARARQEIDAIVTGVPEQPSNQAQTDL